MAKRKSKKKSSGRKGGKRVRGASGYDALYMVIGGLVGSIGMSWISQKVTMLSGKWAGLAELVAGGLLAWKVGAPFAKGLGVGIAIAGGQNTAKGFGLLAGIGATRNFRQQQYVGAGYRDMPKIGQPFPKPAAVGRADTSRVYAGVYN